MNEADFISALRALPLHNGARDLQDDCAVLEIGDETLILTHDAMAQGTHFHAQADMADVAWKLVASNLSDLAAKGAEPIGVLLGHSLGSGDERFLHGLSEALTEFDVSLLGGDTVSAKGPRTLGLTAIGRATYTPVPDRRTAKVGDALYVTGTLGMAMLGFEDIGSGLANDLAFRRPHALVAEGQALAPHVSAMMDISDGLLLDCWRMATASGVSLQLDSKCIPVADPTRLNDCIRWGDDYQLLFTLPHAQSMPVAATRIGSVDPKGSAPLMLDGHPVGSSAGLGYQHEAKT